jgi:hypothetical protein
MITPKNVTGICLLFGDIPPHFPIEPNTPLGQSRGPYNEFAQTGGLLFPVGIFQRIDFHFLLSNQIPKISKTIDW